MQIVPRVVDLFRGDVMFAEVHRTDPVADYEARRKPESGA
jgi:hypothetical protein